MVRATILTLLVILFGAVISPLVEPFVQTWLTEHGYYSRQARWLSIAMNWVISLVGEAAFPWVAGGVMGAAVGAWSMVLAGRIDRRSPSKERRFEAMHHEIVDASKMFWEGQNRNGEYDFSFVNNASKIRLNALYERLRALGVRPPPTASVQNARDYNVMQLSFLQAIEPYARNGSISGANKEATAQISALKTVVHGRQLTTDSAEETKQ